MAQSYGAAVTSELAFCPLSVLYNCSKIWGYMECLCQKQGTVVAGNTGPYGILSATCHATEWAGTGWGPGWGWECEMGKGS